METPLTLTPSEELSPDGKRLSKVMLRKRLREKVANVEREAKEARMTEDDVERKAREVMPREGEEKEEI